MKGEVNSVLFERVTAVLPMVPLLVVMSIAPLPAHEPYNAAADAPGSTLIDSMSSGLMSATASVLPAVLLPKYDMLAGCMSAYMGMPSITYITFDGHVADLMPLITALTAAPAPPAVELTTRPAAFPVRELMMFASLCVTSSSAWIVCTV